MKPRRPTPPVSADYDSLGANSPALEWAVSHHAADHVCSRVLAKLRRRRRQRLGAAAAFGVLLTVGSLWQRDLPAEHRPVAAVASAAPVVTSPRTEVLPDGTVVELKADAQLTVAFDTALRKVTLERGEAYFRVAKNPLRPFVVTAGGVDVRAVGTAFAVELGVRAVDVVVTEGRVAVEKSIHRYADVDAGNRVAVDFAQPPGAVPIVAVSPPEIEERLSWRVPRLELAATPLSSALVHFNRHSAIRLVLANPELGQLELSGVIRSDNSDSLLRLLRAEFGIEGERQGDTVVLRKK